MATSRALVGEGTMRDQAAATGLEHDNDLREVSGLDLHLDEQHLALDFGPGIVHPPGTKRMLDDVRAMLADPQATGPERLYTIYMDIYRAEDGPALQEQGLLYGAVVYNHGAIGQERLRSQGH